MLHTLLQWGWAQVEVSGEDWYLLETRFIGKDERKQSNTFGKLYLLVCVCACGCVHVYVCVLCVSTSNCLLDFPGEM